MENTLTVLDLVYTDGSQERVVVREETVEVRLATSSVSYTQADGRNGVAMGVRRVCFEEVTSDSDAEKE